MSLLRWSLVPFGAIFGFLLFSFVWAALTGFVAGFGVEAATAALGYAWAFGAVGAVIGGAKTAGVGS